MTQNISTINQAAAAYLQSVQSGRRLNTYKSYKNAINKYLDILIQNDISINNPPSTLPMESIVWAIEALNDYSIATERLYLTAITGFFEFLFAENIASPNLPRIRSIITRRARRPMQRLPQFPKDNIEKVINYVINYAIPGNNNKNTAAVRLRILRDKAFVLVLADTGLRVHEACNLDRGNIDWAEAKAIVMIKGGRESVVRFSVRSLEALRLYITERSYLDGQSGKPLSSLPLFARHDRGAGKKLKRITPTTGRNIVNQYVSEILGPESIGTITPHSFRHYFVTVVLKASGNLKLAQELARHRNIAITQRYAHLSDDELDKGYHHIFNQPNAQEK